MDIARIRTGWLAAVVALHTARSAAVGGPVILLREMLGRDWQQQLVGQAVEAPADASFGPGDIALQGPAGPVAAQLGDITFRADGRSVQNATLWFIADLASMTEDLYTLHWDADPLPQPDTDLSIEADDDAVVLSTSGIAVRLWIGDRACDPPRPAAEVPAPLLALRLADGTSAAASHLYGDVPITAASGQLTAAGPVLAEVTYRYVYADGNELNLTVRLASGDNALHWDADVALDRPDQGWRIVLDPGLPPLLFPVKIEHFSSRACVVRGDRYVFSYQQPVSNLCVLALAEHEPGLVTQLTPWNDWWDDTTQTRFYLWIPDKAMELVFYARDPGAWVNPLPPGQFRSWGTIKHKMMPLRKLADGHIVFEMNLAAGELGGIRRWTLGTQALPQAVMEADDPRELVAWNPHREPHRELLLDPDRPFPRVGLRLNEIQDYVLEWPADPEAPHPRLFTSAPEIEDLRRRVEPDPAMLRRAEQVARQISTVPDPNDANLLAAWLATGDDEWAEKGQLAERLRRHLNLLGRFDTMRGAVVMAALYDAVIDSDLVDANERPYLRGRMAYLAYRLADPANWSIERGYCSGNPNMSVSHLMGLGFAAALLRDHPMAETWAQSTLHRFRLWMEESVGPNGEWGESQHYVHVSVNAMVAFATAAQRAGFADFFADPKFRQLLLYIAKMVYTAPDPQRDGIRVTAPMGRRPSGVPNNLMGMAARATAQTDPTLSRILQFVWAGQGHYRHTADQKYGGFGHVLADPDLPMENPQWGSERFPWWGAVMRQGYGTEHEHYLNVILPGGPVFAFRSALGSVVKFFSRGIPVGGAFSGMYGVVPNDFARQELMQNRVTLARDWTDDADWYNPFGMEHDLLDSTFTALAGMDYLRADMRMTAKHELWPHSRDKQLPPELPAWPPVERRGEPPLDWTRQLTFVKGEDAAAPSYLVFRDTVRGDQPTMWQFWTLSQKIGTPEEAANRGVFLSDAPGAAVAPWRALSGDRFTAVGQFDLDMEYFIGAPRNTPRHTLRYGYTSGSPNPGLEEYQDLLDVRLEGDGHYFVALYPRRFSEPVPSFETLGDGHVMKIMTGDDTDWVFLATDPVQAEADGMRFEGTSATVRRRAAETTLSLGAPGCIVKAEGYALQSPDGAAELNIAERIRVSVSDTSRPHTLTLMLPRPSRIVDAPPGVLYEPAAQDGSRRLRLPADVGQVILSW